MQAVQDPSVLFFHHLFLYFLVIPLFVILRVRFVPFSGAGYGRFFLAVFQADLLRRGDPLCLVIRQDPEAGQIIDQAFLVIPSSLDAADIAPSAGCFLQFRRGQQQQGKRVIPGSDRRSVVIGQIFGKSEGIDQLVRGYRAAGAGGR